MPKPHRDTATRKAAERAFVRPALFVLGWVCLAVGIAGLALPLLPGTVFLILSAACFTRSSPRFERWLLGHPTLGPPVRNWRATRAIPRRAKWFACVSLALSWLILLGSQAPWFAKLAVLLIFCGVAGYIVTRPEA